MYYLGIDLGGTNIAAGIVDEKLNIVAKASVPTGAQRGIDIVMEDMAALCQKLLADNNLTVADIAYAGIASPGTCNSATGVVEYSNNLVMVNYPIAKVLSERPASKRCILITMPTAQHLPKHSLARQRAHPAL